MCYHIYVIIHVKYPYTSVTRVWHRTCAEQGRYYDRKKTHYNKTSADMSLIE